jgi:hypothetical protein
LNIHIHAIAAWHYPLFLLFQEPHSFLPSQETAPVRTLFVSFPSRSVIADDSCPLWTLIFFTARCLDQPCKHRSIHPLSGSFLVSLSAISWALRACEGCFFHYTGARAQDRVK